MRRATLLGLTGVLTAVALLLPGVASAATPGKIAFVSDRVGEVDRDIWLMSGADGSGLLNITNNTFVDQDPSWSPDGKQIAFFSDRDGGPHDDLWVMNADGTGARQLTNGFNGGSVDWAPDGKTLVLTEFEGPEDNLHIVNSDGTGLHQITFVPVGSDAFGSHFSPDGQSIVYTNDGPGPGADDFLTIIKPDGTGAHAITSINSYAPDFTADGKRIVFYSNRADADQDNEIMSIAVNGTDLRQLTFTPIGAGDDDFAPSPSRDGLNRIAFVSGRDTDNSREIFVMNADGSGVTQLTHDGVGDQNRGPDWQPNVICQGKVATIVGTAAAETLSGGPNADIISGQGGKDQISGLAGNDIACGDAGKDTLKGGKGKDVLNGGKGNDKLIGGKGKDKCIGGKGKKDTGKSCEKEKKIP
jgi:Tol biopolymer transport system component